MCQEFNSLKSCTEHLHVSGLLEPLPLSNIYSMVIGSGSKVLSANSFNTLRYDQVHPRDVNSFRLPTCSFAVFYGPLN